MAFAFLFPLPMVNDLVVLDLLQLSKSETEWLVLRRPVLFFLRPVPSPPTLDADDS
jgi:hypothetical protein